MKMTDTKNEISVIEIIQYISKLYKYLLSKWLIICAFGVVGALIGLGASFVIKLKYTAHLSFALVEKSSGGGGLADLASSFGFSGLMGGSANGAFSGDNLLEIMKSRHTVESTLLTPVKYKNETTNLIAIYIEFNDLRKIWSKDKRNPDLSQLKYPLGQPRETFTRIQDSVLFSVYDKIMKSQNLKIARKDKKLSFVSMDFTSINEEFSKLFVETLIDQTYKFYKETKTSQSIFNINMMQQKADSVKALYETAMYRGATFSTVNINPALQTAAVPRLKQESDAKLYGSVYTEILKNLETLKLDLARETPIIQVIDKPRLPLKKDKLGKFKGALMGGVIGSLLILVYLLCTLYFKESMLKYRFEKSN
jgi:hypothetical protein